MKRSIDVVGAVIVRQGLVFCVQRGPHVTLAGMWEFPGGKVERGESDSTALVREIREELLCQVIVGDQVTTTTYEYDFGIVRLTTYFCELDDAQPQLQEHAAQSWASPEQLRDLNWAPADVPAAELVANRLLGSM